MRKLSDKCLATLKALPIAEIAGRYTALKPAGHQLKGLSPFTREKTPSFVVTPDTGRFHCFSTNKGGDTIDCVAMNEGLTFMEAAEALAYRYNVPLDYVGGNNAPQRSTRTELFTIHEIALRFFCERFTSNVGVQTYWTRDRAFKIETATEFEIGFAPTDDDGELARRVFAAKVSPQAIRDCGLFYVRGGLIKEASQLTCRFSGRLIIPIHDAQGRCCAFAGRQIPGVEDRTEVGKKAKYLNSPETPIFAKAKIVFNLHRARAALRDASDKDRILMVEGQLDVIRIWESGFKLVVGSQGTATTTAHLEQLGRYANGVRCLMDGDTAGQNAALRLIPLSLEAETDMVFTPMPQGHDPDSILRGISPEEAAARFRVILARSLTPVGFAIEHLMPKPHQAEAATAQGKARIVKEVLDLLSASPSPVAIWYHLEEAAKRLRIDHVAVWHEFLRKHNVDPKVPPAPTARADT